MSGEDNCFQHPILLSGHVSILSILENVKVSQLRIIKSLYTYMLHVSIINLNSNDLNFLYFLPCFDNFSFNENVDIKFSAHMTFLVYVHNQFMIMNMFINKKKSIHIIADTTVKFYFTV
jgi:hypothetical protein